MLASLDKNNIYLILRTYVLAQTIPSHLEDL